MTKTKTLLLVRATTCATTYEFRVTDGDFGWAICTVNDGTGELLITSDWGNWSYMWSAKPSHLGMASLTHFIGDRGGVDYLADKLLGRRGAQRFDVDATTAHFKKLLCALRLEDGRDQERRIRDNWCEDREIPAEREKIAMMTGPLVKNYAGRYYMTAGGARALWDDLESLGSDVGDHHEGAETLYIERFLKLDGYELISEEPWEELQHRESHESAILRQTILPALRDACHVTAQTPPYQEKQAAFEVWQKEDRAKRAAEEVARAMAGAVVKAVSWVGTP